MQLIFKSVTIQNFMSVGDQPITINLDTKVITGIVGKNGSGKSSLTVEAIGFCLFNKSFRGVTKPKLVNSTNRKGTQVTVEFEKESTQVRVIRGIKPDIFSISINGSELDQTNSATFQHTLEKVLGFDFGTFVRTTMLGNANYIPFMVMKSAPRREFVEAVLDLGLFTDLNKLVKAEMADINSSMGVATSELASKRAVLAEKLRANTQRAIDNSGRLQEAKTRLDGHLQDTALLMESVSTLSAKVSANTPIAKKIADKIQAINTEIRDLHKAIAKCELVEAESKKKSEFFFNTPVCPSCDQPMSADHRYQHDEKEKEVWRNTVLQRRTHEAAIIAKTADLSKLNAGQKSIDATIAELDKNKIELRLSISASQQAQTVIENLQKLSEPEDTAAAQQAVSLAQEKFQEIEQQIADYKIALELLKDTGVKAKLVSDVIPMLNKMVNECLDALSIGIRLTFDENFDEVLVGRYADEFDYASLSQGERARVNLAVMFAWQQLQAIAAGVQSNLLIIDEVGFADLDADGVDAMFAILRKLWQNQSVFIICHDPYAHAQCDELIQIVKVGGFTKVI